MAATQEAANCRLDPVKHHIMGSTLNTACKQAVPPVAMYCVPYDLRGAVAPPYDYDCTSYACRQARRLPYEKKPTPG